MLGAFILLPLDMKLAEKREEPVNAPNFVNLLVQKIEPRKHKEASS